MYLTTWLSIYTAITDVNRLYYPLTCAATDITFLKKVLSFLLFRDSAYLWINLSCAHSTLGAGVKVSPAAPKPSLKLFAPALSNRNGRMPVVPWSVS